MFIRSPSKKPSKKPSKTHHYSVNKTPFQVAAGPSTPPPCGHRRLRARLRVAARPGPLRDEFEDEFLVGDGAGGGDEWSTTDGDAARDGILGVKTAGVVLKLCWNMWLLNGILSKFWRETWVVDNGDVVRLEWKNYHFPAFILQFQDGLCRGNRLWIRIFNISSRCIHGRCYSIYKQ